MAADIEYTALKRTDKFNVLEEDLVIDEAKFPESITDSDRWRLRLDNDSATTDSFWVVSDVLESTQGMVDQYSEKALESLDMLGQFPTNTIPDSNIQLDMPTVPSVDSINIAKPGRPGYSIPDVGSAPGMRGNIITPTLEPVDSPTINYPDEPTREVDWSEAPYMSDLLDNLTASINDIILNGGTGLSEDYETAVYNRAIARLDLAHEEKYIEAEDYYAAKGHVAPPGAVVARLNMLNRERLREEALISSDIAAKSLELAHEHIKFNKDLAVKLEQLTMQQKSDVENRALEAIRTTITLLYERYKVTMEGLKLKVDVFRSEVDAERTRVEAVSVANKSITDTLIAETDAWKARINAEFSVIESIIRMYIAELGGYETEVNAEAQKLSALIERYKAQVGAEEVQGQISLGEYEQLVKALLGQIELILGSQKTAGQIAAQVAASALSAFNASASISDSASRSKSYNEGKSMSMSNQFTRSMANQLSVSYGMDERMSDSYQESKTYNYTE